MAEEEFRRYKPDYTGMQVNEYEFCRMKDCSGKEESFSLDVIMKENDLRKDRPAVIFVHGGGFLKPNDKRQAYISRFAKVLTEKGYAVISPDYPQFDSQEQYINAGGESAGYTIAAEAVHYAYEWMQNNAEKLGIDRNRVDLMGGSAGGMAAFHAAGRYPDHYHAFVCLWGVPDQLPDVSRMPPVLMIHGTADELVPYSRTGYAVRTLTENGIANKLITLQGCGHTPLMKMNEFLPEIISFLEM